MIRILPTLVLVSALFCNVTAQQEMATWLMSDLHQSQLLNPAWGAQQEKFTIALPGLFLNARLPVSPATSYRSLMDTGSPA
ncbi:MAG: hypothetical protein ACO4CH_02210, partial [Saprospiraceae bacterium]